MRVAEALARAPDHEVGALPGGRRVGEAPPPGQVVSISKQGSCGKRSLQEYENKGRDFPVRHTEIMRALRLWKDGMRVVRDGTRPAESYRKIAPIISYVNILLYDTSLRI